MAGIYRNWDQTQFEAYLERFRLDGGQPIKNYSRGMRMKLNLALAMSHHARLLILDEPASGLDPVVREGLLELLEDFVGDEEHGVLVSSPHHQRFGEGFRLCGPAAPGGNAPL